MYSADLCGSLLRGYVHDFVFVAFVVDAKLLLRKFLLTDSRV